MNQEEIRYKKLQKEKEKLSSKREILDHKISLIAKEEEKILANMTITLCRAEKIDLFELKKILKTSKERKDEKEI